MKDKLKIMKTKKTKVKKASVKKVSTKKKSIKKIVAIPEIKDSVSVRYTIIPTSLSVDGYNLIETIIFDVQATFIIPKSLKSTVDAKSIRIQGSYKLKSKYGDDDYKNEVLTTDYKLLTKNQVHMFLINNIRPEYLQGVKDVAYKELAPQHKIIEKIVWK